MKKIILLAISCVFALSACSDFLDEKPSTQADSETAIATVRDAEIIMNGLMRNMTSTSYYGRNMFLYADAKGGDLCIGGRGRGYEQFYTFAHSPSSYSYSGFWSQIFYCIAQTNNLVNSIDKLVAAGSAEDFDEVKGQALTVRALCYFDLVRLYGKPYDMDKTSYGVPLVLELLDALAQPTRASVEDIYTQIVKDLTEAAPLLSKSKRNGYVNYYANKGIQARVYMQMQRYDDALSAAEEIINDGVYELYTNSNWIDSWSQQFGTESIFELGIYPEEADAGRTSLGSMTINSNDYSETNWDYYIASDAFLARLGEDADDIRWGLMGEDEKSETGAVRKGCCYKYLGGIDAPGDGKATSTAVNIKVIRLSEIYLIAAEAAFSKPTPDKQKAADYLQEIRKRAPNLAPATAATVTLDMILDEKSKELFTEGHRFFDMIRLNKSITYNDVWAQSPITTRPATIDRTYFKTILPIDQDEIHANPALKDEQNPQY